ncbi:MAG: hypothetical protein EPO68_14455 [Planctomycetota bacterium]|nr:MAG: hypothetical protein EPO68_14455 [Planctomycetota bacterium]
MQARARRVREHVEHVVLLARGVEARLAGVRRAEGVLGLPARLPARLDLGGAVAVRAARFDRVHGEEPHKIRARTAPTKRYAAHVLATLLLVADVTVRTSGELRAALAAAKPGTTLLVAPGEYAGGIVASGVRGTAAQPIALRAADPAQPPLIRGGTCGIQLSDAEHVELADLVFEQQTGNGVNIDDGGTLDTPARGIALRRLVVRDTGPQGNCDGLKLSGVDGFAIEGCTIERWGSNGSGIDLVGCANGAVERCTLRNPADRATSSGVQAKGGSRAIRIERNRFEHAGQRAVNIGGSTGLDYFRPPLSELSSACSEAARITVAGNTFVGSDAPIACVGVDGAQVRFNTLYRPQRWALRILQETRDPRFVPCRNVEFTDNLVVFERARWSAGGVNVGAGTEPDSFRFERNAWTCSDDAARSRELVKLPTPERDGRYGVDPQFLDAASLDLSVRAGSPAAGVGAHAFGAQAAREPEPLRER